jgi:opine dehydrogenase
MGPASVMITGVKEGLRVAAFPSNKIGEAMPLLQRIYPTLESAPNILWTGLSNPNPISHPAITILNTARIENTAGGFLFYVEGVTPAVRRVVDALDNERIAVGSKLRLELVSNTEMTRLWYRHQLARNEMNRDTAQISIYARIKAEKELASRYLSEDVPYGLVPWEEIGKLVGIDMPTCTSLINLSNTLLGADFRRTGRTLKYIGIRAKTVHQLIKMVEEGDIA